METKIILTHQQVETLCMAVLSRIPSSAPCWPEPPGNIIRIFPIPRGGVPVAYMLAGLDKRIMIVNNPEDAMYFVDDIVDSGRTVEKWASRFKMTPFLALIDKKRRGEFKDKWVVFPWEHQDQSGDDSIVGTITNRFRDQEVSFKANDNIAYALLPGEMEAVEVEVAKRAQSLLEGLLIDTKNDHNTCGTAKRLAKLYCREIFRGRFEAAPVVTDFPNAAKLDELYITGPITIRSTCSHHLCPIVGKAWIGVIPSDRVVGLSKFNRLVDWICSRPQIQEEMVVQVADLLEHTFAPVGIAVVIQATHTCMTWRGVRESTESAMTTSVMRGAFRDKPAARAEFLGLIKG